MALGARVRLVSRSGEREVALADLYNNDGIGLHQRRPDEILSEVLLDSLHGWKSNLLETPAPRLVRLSRAVGCGGGAPLQR